MSPALVLVNSAALELWQTLYSSFRFQDIFPSPPRPGCLLFVGLSSLSSSFGTPVVPQVLSSWVVNINQNNHTDTTTLIIYLFGVFYLLKILSRPKEFLVFIGKKKCSDVDSLDKTSKCRTELLQLALFSLTFSAVVFAGCLNIWYRS